MSKSEKAIMNDALVALSALPNTLVYRNNSGKAWQGAQVRARVGDTVRVESDMIILRGARLIPFGLTGSADIMGCSDGLAVAVEIKTDTGSQSSEQSDFEKAWVRAGGVYILARSTDDALKQLNRIKLESLL